MTRLLPLALLALLLAAVPSAAQQPVPAERPQPTVAADGTEVFQFLLDRAKLKPVRADEIWNLPRINNDVVVIVLGRSNNMLPNGHTPMSLANAAIQAGGAALIASDAQTLFANAFQNARGGNLGNTSIPEGRVAGGNNTKPESLFLGRPNMPFVVPLRRPGGFAGPEWKIFEGLSRIATNKPSLILAPEARGEFGSRLASYPEDCNFQIGQRSGDVDHDEHFFAVGGTGGQNRVRYRFLALADPSVFINQMMMASDENGAVDNLEFSARIVSYLVEKDDGTRRTRCLLIQDGVVVESFDSLRNMMQPQLPMPNIMAMQDKLTDFGNQILDDFQSKDRAFNALMGLDEERQKRNFASYFKYLISTLILLRVVWYLVNRTWTAKRPAEGPPPPSGGLPVAKKNAKLRGLFDRRQKELFRRNNIYEPIRTVVREMFLAAGAPENPGKRMPEVGIMDAVTRPETLVDALTDLWKIAYGPARVVTVDRWKRLAPLLDRVRQANADGKWRFV